MSDQCASQHVCTKTGRKVVTAILDDGRRFEGDILIGADGIWSKVGCPRVPVAAHRITCGDLHAWRLAAWQTHCPLHCCEAAHTATWSIVAFGIDSIGFQPLELQPHVHHLLIVGV